MKKLIQLIILFISLAYSQGGIVSGFRNTLSGGYFSFIGGVTTNTVSGYYAAGASLAQMAEAIVLDKKRLIPCSAHLTGQYGIDDLYIGVPIILGADGIEKIVEIDLSSEELDSLHRSAATYREGIGVIGY